MTPDRWNRIRSLFDAVVDRPSAERSAHLDRECPNDEGLRAEVEALLHAHDRADAEGALDHPFDLAPAPEADATGERVGPYRLLRLLGRGGMGAVYLAERADGQFEHTVALKLIRRGLDTDDVLARFAFERQVLAGLDHPGIARLYDGGVAEDGRPYFVMEAADGEPITEYCDRRRLSIRERLDVFRTVCHAVQHAHRNLVVHRDLKPSNILVADPPPDAAQRTPVVKLLDFGIAKLLSDAPTASAAPRTRTGHVILTPEYAAPEQVRGEAVTTGTDVYQLGVLLYELLTGHRPHRIDSRVRAEIERVIAEVDPDRPSTAVGQTREEPANPTGEANDVTHVTPETVSRDRSTQPHRLRRRLEGDLDVICLKALQKDPARRYENVDALADDLARHLDGRPVQARPDSLTYRASRFVRRHRLAVAAAALVLLAIVGGSGVAIWQSRVAAAERDRAEAALVQAEGTLDFLEQVIASGGPNEGDPNTPVGVVLDSAAARVATDLAEQPTVARAVYTSLAHVYFGMGRLDDAESVARAALDLYGPVRDPGYGRTAQVLALTLDYRDDHDASIRYHEEAIDALRSAPGREALLAATYNTYAAVLLETAREDEAQTAYEASLTLFREIGDPDVVYPLAGLGVLHNHRGRFDAALPLLMEVVDVLRERHDGAHYTLGESLGNVASTLGELGRFEEALTYRREAVEMLLETVGETHHSTIISQAAYSNELRSARRVEAAQQAGAGAVTASTKAFGPSHSLTAYAQNVAGQAFCAGDDPSAGVEMLRLSLDTRQQVLPDGHWLIANGESLLGDCLARAGDRQSAEPLLRAGYEGLRNLRGDDHKKTLEALERLQRFDATDGA